MDPMIAAAAVTAAFLFFRKKRSKAKDVPTTPELDEDVPEGPKPDASGQDATMLAGLGYGNTTSGVLAFQSDWNFVENAYKLWKLLAKDGKMGENTRGALIRAINYAKNQNKSWEAIVIAAIAAQPQFQMSANDRGNFQSLGYTVNSKTVKKFQKDFNITNLWWMDKHNGAALLSASLEEDGNLGPVTRKAVIAAQDAQVSAEVKWRDLVKKARQAA